MVPRAEQAPVAHADNSEFRQASSLRPPKDSGAVPRNSLLSLICARAAAAAVLPYSKLGKTSVCSDTEG